MTYPVTQSKLNEAAQRVNAVVGQLYNRAPAWKARAEAEFSLLWLVSDVLPYINANNGVLKVMRDSAILTQVQKDAFETFAIEGMETPPADYWAEYDAVRAAVVVFGQRARAIANASVADAYSVAATGVVTWKTIPADTQLADAAQGISDTLS